MRLKRFCVCLFPKARDASFEARDESSDEAPTDEEQGPVPAIPEEAPSPSASSDRTDRYQEPLRGPCLALPPGEDLRVVSAIRQLSALPLEAEAEAEALERSCLLPAFLRLSPPRARLEEVRQFGVASDKAREAEEVQKLFGLVAAFQPRTVDLATELKPFIPDFIPAIGEVPCGLRVPRPLGDVPNFSEVSEMAAGPKEPERRRPNALLKSLLAKSARRRGGPLLQLRLLPKRQCRNAPLVRWLRRRAMRRKLRRVGCAPCVLAGAEEEEAEISDRRERRDHLASWLTRPQGRRALRRLQRRSAREGTTVPAPAREESSIATSWATALDGGDGATDPEAAGSEEASPAQDDGSSGSLEEYLPAQSSPRLIVFDDDFSFFSAGAEELEEPGGGSRPSTPPLKPQYPEQVASVADALETFYEFLEIFLEHYKAQALKMSFLEPAKYYYTVTEDRKSRDRVDVDVAQFARRLLSARLGVAFASSAAGTASGASAASVPDVWRRLPPPCWERFLDPIYFGVDFEDIPIPDLAEGPLVLPREDAEELDEDGCRRLIQSFTRFLDAEVLLPQVHEALSPTALAALSTLYGIYREELQLPEAALELHCWPEGKLDVSRFACLLAWLGVVRWTEDLLQTLAHQPRIDTCPICCEEKLDVEPLEHWSPKGDVSEHRMCGSCRFEYGQSQCPFCKEFLLKEELIDFIDKLGASIREDGRWDPFEVSSLLEQWQFHEMEFEAQPMVIRRWARLMIEDRNVRERLEEVVLAERHGWLVACSGLLLRLWGIDQVRPLSASSDVSGLLQNVVELLMEPLERGDEEAIAAGTLYAQALLAWLCAHRQEPLSAAPLAKIARRIGWALVLCHARGNSAERARLCHELRDCVTAEHFEAAHLPIWGSRSQDIVWQTFCV